MNSDTIESLAAARGQHVILAEVKGKPSWLLVDKWPCTIDDAAQSLRTDGHIEWTCGELLAFDENGALLLPDQSAPKVIRFFKRPKRAKTICGLCGLTLHLWRFGWKHASGGAIRLDCCDKPTPVSLTPEAKEGGVADHAKTLHAVVRPKSKLCFICGRPVRGRGYASRPGLAHKKCAGN
jgi:hypothetical protein